MVPQSIGSWVIPIEYGLWQPGGGGGTSSLVSSLLSQVEFPVKLLLLKKFIQSTRNHLDEYRYVIPMSQYTNIYYIYYIIYIYISCNHPGVDQIWHSKENLHI